eukprot:2491492-Alexandrium_andersonii.AAC.1
MGDLRRPDCAQGVARVDNRTGHAAADVSETTAVRIKWQPEARTKFDPAWIPTICHWARTLGSRWDTLLEGRL